MRSNGKQRMSDNAIAQALRMRRAELNQTQAAAAKVCGIHPQTWSLYERGIVKPRERVQAIEVWLGKRLPKVDIQIQA